MPSIRVADLYPAGSELFRDSESFLHELTDDETTIIAGGGKWGRLKSLVNVVIIVSSVSAITVVTNTINANTVGNANTL